MGEQQFKSNLSVSFGGSHDLMLTLRDDDDKQLVARLVAWDMELQALGMTPKVIGAAPRAERPAPAAVPAAPARRDPPRKGAVATVEGSNLVLVRRTSRDTLTVCQAETSDKIFTKVKCGEWRAHGVKAWPDPYEPFDIDIESLTVGETFDLPEEVTEIEVLVGDDGKPKKVVRFLTEAAA